MICRSCLGLIDHDAANQVQHYLDHDEYEMAFEGLVWELIMKNVTPPSFDFVVWETLANDMGLMENSIFDDDFWNKFQEWGRQRIDPTDQ